MLLYEAQDVKKKLYRKNVFILYLVWGFLLLYLELFVKGQLQCFCFIVYYTVILPVSHCCKILFTVQSSHKEYSKT